MKRNRKVAKQDAKTVKIFVLDNHRQHIPVSLNTSVNLTFNQTTKNNKNYELHP